MKKLMMISSVLLTLGAFGCDDTEPAAPPAVGAPPAATPSTETEAAEGAEAPAPAEEGLGCATFVAHMVQLSSSLGEEAFVTADNQAQWTQACEAAGDLNEPDNATIATCYMEHDDLASAEGCGNPRFMNRWARHM
jgi:hypothetical protein